MKVGKFWNHKAIKQGTMLQQPCANWRTSPYMLKTQYLLACNVFLSQSCAGRPKTTWIHGCPRLYDFSNGLRGHHRCQNWMPAKVFVWVAAAQTQMIKKTIERHNAVLWTTTGYFIIYVQTNNTTQEIIIHSLRWWIIRIIEELDARMIKMKSWRML